MRLILTLFGGRGSFSGRRNGSIDGVLLNSPMRTIETRVFLRGSRTAWRGSPSYKDTILKATTDNKGNLNFTYATPTINKTAKTNTTGTATFNVAHGAINGKSFGINWDKVKSISGETYAMRDEAKKNGFRWDSTKKIWTK